MAAGEIDDKAKTSEGEELKDSDLEAIAGGLSALDTGKTRTPAFKVEIEGVKGSATEAAPFDEADALFGKR